MIEVKINGLFMTQSQSSGVILKEIDGDKTLPIIIGEYEAQSIALGLESIAPPRPITHDLLLNMLESLNAHIERIIITDLKNNTYYAIIEVLNSGKILEIDARPSDAIALAVRQNIQIFVEEEVMRKGAYSQDEMQELEERQIDSTKDRIDRLKKELQEAVDKEDYEKAAKLRDDINRLESRQ
ncbi:MAG: bifunctional nuclease family protein [Calditrichaeota bacterium]|nr:bifunctional nuclease family protein [Calditrichota bacterium]HQU72519.1 bifunctional nuclease family protein [Calditrichia bacterium]